MDNANIDSSKDRPSLDIGKLDQIVVTAAIAAVKEALKLIADSSPHGSSGIQNIHGMP